MEFEHITCECSDLLHTLRFWKDEDGNLIVETAPSPWHPLWRRVLLALEYVVRRRPYQIEATLVHADLEKLGDLINKTLP